jgi:chromosome segregation ATPase
LATDDEEEDMKKKLADAEEENAKLKAMIAKHENDLQVLGEHSTLMKCEASDASKGRDRAQAELATMSEEFEGMRARHSALQESHAALQAEHAELQEDHSILKEELGQLEEKQAKTLKQLQES